VKIYIILLPCFWPTVSSSHEEHDMASLVCLSIPHACFVAKR